MANPTAFSGQSPLPEPGALSSPFTPPGSGRAHYRTSGARTTMFSFIFLLLLPFFVSLPAMIVMRIMSGRWDATLGVAILAIGFAVIMFLVVVELMFSIRARIDLGDTAVKMTLPAGRGLMPMLRYQRHQIPYSDIKAIESRREIYGGTLAPVLMRGARIVTKDDRSIQLGYLNEANVDPAFPYSEIAEQIAARAGLQVIDRGAVRRNVANKVMGIRTMDDGGGSIDEATIADLNRRHAHVIIVLVAGLVLLVGIGIAGDLLTQSDTVAGQPKAGAPQKATPPQKK